VLAAVVVLLSAVLSACGGSSTTQTRKTPTTKTKRPGPPFVDIYAGLPLRGPLARQGRAVWKGIKLARDNARIHDSVHLRFKLPLNDAGRKTGAENLALTAKNAIAVSMDPHAVYYIGDLSSAATNVSLPILNAAGIAQITPGDAYIAPASAQSGAVSLADKLLPLLPDYTVQAAADMQFFAKVVTQKLKQPACTRVIVVAESDPESAALAKLMSTDAKSYGVQPFTPLALTTKAATAATYETPFSGQAPCGIVIAGRAVKPAVAFARTIHSLFPAALILGTSGLCNSRWTKATAKGWTPAVDRLLWCTSPTWPLNEYDNSDDFTTLYRKTYHSNPSTYALYGYEAANLGIAMLGSLGTAGEDREAVRSNLLDPGVRDSFQYANLKGNTSSLISYAVYDVSPRSAEPTFELTLTPGH
jgi:branched-chain amino acid transport system substrate-binding protein